MASSLPIVALSTTRTHAGKVGTTKKGMLIVRSSGLSLKVTGKQMRPSGVADAPSRSSKNSPGPDSRSLFDIPNVVSELREMTLH